MGSCFSCTLPQVFPGVHLPNSVSIFGKIRQLLDLNLQTNTQVVKYLLSTRTINNFKGEPKTNLSEAQKVLTNLTQPTEAFQIFGNDDFATMLPLLLKTNPFFATALTWNGGLFELKAFDPAERNPSLFLKIMRTLNGVGHRVNFKFHPTMEIASFSVYDDMEGKLVPGTTDMSLYASSALYNLIFYSSAIHATIHVFHYLLTTAFSESSTGFSAMNKWAETYDNNIAIKYFEVGALLINDPPEDPSKPDDAIITGVDGFGSSQVIKPILAEMLNSWGRCTSAKEFMALMLNVPDDRMQQAGILTEFNKHLALVEPFAAAAASALKDLDASKYGKAQEKLTRFLQSCGSFQSRISTVESWVELMAVTGIIHGCTLSYTRLAAMAPVMRWRNYRSQHWDAADLNIIIGGLGTIVGMEEGRHVMGARVDGKQMVNALQDVLVEYDGRAQRLKEAYQAEIMTRPDFNQVGFILTDFCPDGFDGKQLTIATYI